MVCLLGLGGFSTYVMLAPAKPIALVLDIIDFTLAFRFELLVIAAINIIACFAFERFAERPIARVIAYTKRALRKRRKGERRRGEGSQYKRIEGDMR